MMPLRLPGDGLLKYLSQIFLAASVSKGGFDVYLIVSEKVWANLAVCREPEAVTQRAEMVAEGTDETNFPFG